MTREDIASYLGMKLETVSRGLSRFNREGAVDVHGRSICIRDRRRLDRASVWGGAGATTAQRRGGAPARAS